MVVDLFVMVVAIYVGLFLYALLHDGDSLPVALLFPLQQVPAWIRQVDPNIGAQAAAVVGVVSAEEQKLLSGLLSLQQKGLIALTGALTPPAPATPVVPGPINLSINGVPVDPSQVKVS